MRKHTTLCVFAVLATASLALSTAPANAQWSALIRNAIQGVNGSSRTPCDSGIPDNSCKPGQIPGHPAPQSLSIVFTNVAGQPIANQPIYGRSIAVWPGSQPEVDLGNTLAQSFKVSMPRETGPLLEAAHFPQKMRGMNGEDLKPGFKAICAGTGDDLVLADPATSRDWQADLLVFDCKSQAIVWQVRESLVPANDVSDEDAAAKLIIDSAARRILEAQALGAQQANAR